MKEVSIIIAAAAQQQRRTQAEKRRDDCAITHHSTLRSYVGKTQLGRGKNGRGYFYEISTGWY